MATTTDQIQNEEAAHGPHPHHPGEILRYDFLDPLDQSARDLAAKLHIPNNRVSDLIRGMTADTALRLARHFDTTPLFWMNLQANHDLSKAEAQHDDSDVEHRLSA